MMRLGHCVICRASTETSPLTLPATGRTVQVCADTASCLLNRYNELDMRDAEALQVFLAEQALHNSTQAALCSKCGDMVYNSQQRVYTSSEPYTGVLHYSCFIGLLGDKLREAV